MKKLLLVLAIAMMAIPSLAQNGSYTRCQGFFVRPSLFGGAFVDAGYQFNPYIQASVGGGVSLLARYISRLAIDPAYVAHGGIRVYTSKNRWTGMIDYHAGYCNYLGYDFLRHSLVGGASFDSLDFGGGLYLMNNTKGDYAYGVLVTVGWNFRFCKH